MITLILNDKLISTNISEGEVILDFLRREMKLHGTKEGCREGDCGACTVLIGELSADEKEINYKTVPSCLTPVGTLHRKHLVTIEGLNNQDTLSPVQQAIVDEGATQCGFCTPGIVMSLTGFLLTGKTLSEEDALTAIEGNICRCTGYTAIRRAVSRLLQNTDLKMDNSINRHEYLYSKNILPDIFHDIINKLAAIKPVDTNQYQQDKIIVAGGTDLFVTKAEKMLNEKLHFFTPQSGSNISLDNKSIIIEAATSTEELRTNKIFSDMIPRWQDFLHLLSSTLIRNRATLAGNIVNASPIADLSIIFLALNAELIISSDTGKRRIALDKFYKGYKEMDLNKKEFIEKIIVHKLPANSHFNFEKVAKREHLDIATVNSAITITEQNNIITAARISAGGVSPTPLLLQLTSEFLIGKPVNPETVIAACTMAKEEVSPISDVRGSAAYKRTLLTRLIIAHFIECFPGHNWQEVINELT